MNIEDKVRYALRTRADLVEVTRAKDHGDPYGAGPAGQRVGVGHRIAAGLVAAAVALGGLGIVFTALRPAPVGEGARGQAWSEFEPGWTKLPNPAAVHGSAWVWTGSEIITWGGTPEGDQSIPSASGSRFDPLTGRWRPMPEAPEPRDNPHAVWTGEEVLFWGGWDGTRQRTDGLAFDPASGGWRAIPPAPLPAGNVAVTVWTGEEMIVWGGGREGPGLNRSGAAYDPARDSWRELSPAPVGLNSAHGVWTGTEVFVFGSMLDGRNISTTQKAVGARYDPATDRWFEVPASDLSPQASALGFVDGELIAYDYAVRSQTYDLARDRWSEPMRMPLRASECYPDLAVVRDVAFAFFCGQAATYESGTGWKQASGGMLDETYEDGGDSYPLYRFATVTPVGEGIVFAVEGITILNSGQTCYGCPGAPRAVWFWRPSPVVSTDAVVQDLEEARAAAPYEVRVPDMPDGSKLIIVQWGLPDEEQSGQLVSIDITYELPDGQRVHVWQRNQGDRFPPDPDPAAIDEEASLLDLDNGRWTRRFLDFPEGPRVELSRYFEDDVVLFIDAPAGSEDLLHRLAAGL